jgi:hypothetical protein
MPAATRFLTRNPCVAGRRCMIRSILASIAVSVASVSVHGNEEKIPVEIPKKSLPQAHSVRDIEGWRVRVDERLLNGDNAALGSRALKVLEARLVLVTQVVPAKALGDLRKVIIQIDLDYGGLKNMQYHPGAGWLRANGYSAELEKCVHIPEARDILSGAEARRHPWVVLHELAHAFHDQFLGFEEPKIKKAWEKFRDSGKYKSVPTTTGGDREHYGMTNQKEFFAEMTESFFGSNDFYPFVSGELRRAEPEIYAVIAEAWGAEK